MNWAGAKMGRAGVGAWLASWPGICIGLLLLLHLTALFWIGITSFAHGATQCTACGRHVEHRQVVICGWWAWTYLSVTKPGASSCDHYKHTVHMSL